MVMPMTLSDCTAVSPIPQDLRHAYRPIHTLLSEAAAGTSTPATDMFDISVIREEWVRSQVKQHYYTLDKQGKKTTLKYVLLPSC